MNTGRVKISGNERWVGFVPAGYAAGNCTGGTCDTRGKGFYVIDLLTGNVLWTFTRANNSSMNYSLVGQPASIDLDDDGFIDAVYAGDLGGNVWRFKFCKATDSSSCSTSAWTGGLFYSGNGRPIFTKPAVVRALNGDVWVYFGTGDETDPTNATTSDKMYAVKDNDQTTTWNISNLYDITSTVYDCARTDKDGWYISLASGQKILSDATVYADVLYFTVYAPGNLSDACDRGGNSYLYAVNYCSGAGVGSGGSRIVGTQSGISPGLSVSQSPSGDSVIYFPGQDPPVPYHPDSVPSGNTLQYWHDMRVQ
jgi:type IV pilus assembly protein PilY1